MANCRDDRNRGGSDGPNHLLLVEGPQILDRTAAARDDEEVRRVGKPIEPIDRGGDLGRRTLALDRDGPEPDMAGEAIFKAMKDIADDGAGR